MTLNITHVTRNPIVCSSMVAGAIGWITLLIGSYLAGSKGLVWWVIVYEVGLTVGILYILMKSAFPDYRLPILVSLAISITLLTQIIDTQLHVGLGSAKAAAGGGIMVAIMQFFWVLVFGSTPGSWIYGAIYGLPTSASYHNKEGLMLMSNSTIYSLSHNDSIQSSLASVSHDMPYSDQQFQPHQQQQYQVYSSPASSQTVPDVPANYAVAANNAIALHPYTANPDDPNELAFEKGEVLEILDRRGNWWQARKQDQTIGIVPSNYFTS